ncbi:MAG: sigma-54-dependent Fis family transcriptional regulator [Deltaproteobacteria bacterium]|nr:sigma-54-dependent Fis family transcriptional regulator [Deltaproteobacteria bacterium]
MGKLKILVVDDDGQMRSGLKEALTRYGYSVDPCVCVDEALKAMAKTRYAMVITDMRMPGQSGLDLLTEVQKRFPETPVVVMTAFGTIQDAVDVMKGGAFDYLMKPFDREILGKVVARALGETTKPTRRKPSRSCGCRHKVEKEFVTRDPAMIKTLRFIREISTSDSTVLIQGESGTGKELIARMIHQNSSVASGHFVAVNCAAIPEGLLESELFGYEKGAFSGAHTRKIGKFEQADGGTLLLDEVGEMDLILQAKLLRVIQEREIDRIGGSRAIPVHVRILATTNRDLRREVEEGRFREDLFYRLNVVPLRIPPLRERPCDILPLCEYFIRRRDVGGRRGTRRLSPEAVSFLKKKNFPGNARELENLIERAMLVARGDVIGVDDLTVPDCGVRPTESIRVLPGKGGSVKDMEQELVLQTLREVHGNRTQAAVLLGISIRTLRNKLAEYRKIGITVPDYEPARHAGKRGAALRCAQG